MNLLKFKNVRLAVFDMAGTTVKEHGIIYETLYNTLKAFSYDVDKKDIKKWHGLNKYQVLDKYLNKHNRYSEKHKINVYKTFESNLRQEYFFSDKISLMDEKMPEKFNKLRSMNIKIGLNTGYPRDIQNEIIKKLHMREFTDSFVSSEDVDFSRPYPFMIYKLMEMHKIESSRQVIKVGDTTNDILEGLNARCMKSIGVLSGAETEEELNKAGADFTVDNVMDLID